MISCCLRSKNNSSVQIPEPRTFVSLDELKQAAPESLTWGQMFYAALGTLKQRILSFFTANPAKKYLENVPDTHPYHSSLANLAKRGTELSPSTLDLYLTLEEAKYCKGYFTTATNVKPEQELADFLIQDQPFSIPVVVDGTLGQHIVNLKCVKDGQNWKIEFFDSKGLALNHPKNKRALDVVEQIENISEISQTYTKPIQFDGHSCGVFVAWHVVDGKGEPPLDIEAYRLTMVWLISEEAGNVQAEQDRSREVDVYDADDEISSDSE